MSAHPHLVMWPAAHLAICRCAHIPSQPTGLPPTGRLNPPTSLTSSPSLAAGQRNQKPGSSCSGHHTAPLTRRARVVLQEPRVRLRGQPCHTRPRVPARGRDAPRWARARSGPDHRLPAIPLGAAAPNATASWPQPAAARPRRRSGGVALREAGPPARVGVVVGVLGGAVLTFVPQQVDGGADPPAAQAGAPVGEMVVIVTRLVA